MDKKRGGGRGNTYTHVCSVMFRTFLLRMDKE